MIKAILSLIVVVVIVYFLITSIQRYLAGQEEIRKSEEDLKKAEQEHAQAERELEAVKKEYSEKYGCYYPTKYTYVCPPGTPG